MTAQEKYEEIGRLLGNDQQVVMGQMFGKASLKFQILCAVRSVLTPTYQRQYGSAAPL